jgi:hypothetical protein
MLNISFSFHFWPLSFNAMAFKQNNQKRIIMNEFYSHVVYLTSAMTPRIVAGDKR